MSTPESAPQAPALLLVDDDLTLRELLSLILQAQGFIVYEAGDGVQAQRLLRRQPVDLIILDIMMPVMDGMKFLRWLRLDGAYDLPVLCLTALPSAQSRQDLLDLGASAVMVKPVHSDELIGVVHALLAEP